MDARDTSAFAVLAARVDGLSKGWTRLSRENAELRDQVSRLSASTGASANRSAGASVPGNRSAGANRAPQREHRRGRPDIAGGLAGVISRRVIGKALGAVAVATVGAAALVNESTGSAEAADGSPINAGQSTTCESATALKFDGSTGPRNDLPGQRHQLRRRRVFSPGGDWRLGRRRRR